MIDSTRQTAPPASRGGVYIIVLMTVMFVTVTGLASLGLVNSQRRQAQGVQDVLAARSHAQSALDLGLHLIDTTPNWRTSLGNGDWIADRPIGAGTLSLTAVDPDDGNVSNWDGDPLELTGVGRQGTARQMLGVRLESVIRPLDCLESALHSGGELYVKGATVNADAPLTTNDNIRADGDFYVYADAAAVGSINGDPARYFGTRTEGADARAMPAPSAIDQYLSAATWIDRDSFTGNDVERVVISPASNPYGPTNPQGIYAVDAQGRNVIMRNCRVVGTIILINPGNGSKIESSVHWAPAVEHFPVLLVRGDMRLYTTGDDLDEALLDTNFNPPGTPYLGSEDNDKLDTYPSVIEGLVYIEGAFRTLNSPTVRGAVIVGGAARIEDQFDAIHDAAFIANPPPGFRDVSMQVVRGSWRRVVD